MKKTLIVFTLLILGVAGARADLQKGSQSASVFFGGAGSNSELDLGGSGKGNDMIGHGGGALGASYLYYVRNEPLVGVGLDFNASKLDTDHSRDLFPGNDSNTYAHSAIVMAIARLAYPRGKLRPYIQGGLGFDSTYIHMDSQPQSGRTWSDTGTTENRTLFDDRSTTLALGWAVGMEAYLTEHFFLGLEYRNTYFGAQQSPTAAGRAQGLHDINDGWQISDILFRLGWTWGASK